LISVDFHVHSLFSHCGLHTILELLDRARSIGMKGFAITDHGLALGGRLNSVFFERFKCPDPEITIFKGIECNITDNNGTIDLPSTYLPFLDLVLVGIHPNIEKGRSKEHYTSLLIKTLQKNRLVDIVSHPNDPSYPVDFFQLAKAASASGVAMELNNSKILYSRSSETEALHLLDACKTCRCHIAVNSDTHAIHELGDDSAVAPLLDTCGFPKELIVNHDAETAFAFIEKRRPFKQTAVMSL
jgi:putative hydrolase